MALNRRKLIVVPVALACFGATVVFAAWTSMGTGSGTAQSSATINHEIEPAAYAADLYPGATKSVTVTVDNPNDYPVVVTEFSAGTSATLTNLPCAAESVTTDAKPFDEDGHVQSDDSTVVIPAGGSGTYTLVTRMVANPMQGCKSRTFTIGLTANLTSAP